MSDRLAPGDADRLRRAESRWLEQARDRLRRPDRRTRPDSIRSADHEENDR
jgi:hypothetical protein